MLAFLCSSRARVDFFIFYIVLLLYDVPVVNYTKSKKLKKNSRTEHSQYVLVLYIPGMTCKYSIREAAVLPAVRPWKNPKNDLKKNKSRRGAPRLADNRCARTSFGIATTQSLPSFLLLTVQ